MRVRYILEMVNPVVCGERFNSIVIDWEEEATREEVMIVSEKWVRSRNFLTERMNGLNKVGESSLTVEPISM